jgi:hypothetical protein
MQSKLLEPDICCHIFASAPLPIKLLRNLGTLYLVPMLSDDDRALPLAIQDTMIRSLVHPQIFRLESGHSRFLSMATRLPISCQNCAMFFGTIDCGHEIDMARRASP